MKNIIYEIPLVLAERKITEKIVQKVFTSVFNDGRMKCGRVGISEWGDHWYINTVQSYVGKHINTIGELNEFLIQEGVPFNFNKLKVL